MMTKQIQKGGENSTNIQANDITVVQGLTYSEVRDLALDVFRANFYEFSDKAQAIARERAERITEDFLTKLQNENPSAFENAQDPDFQFALLTVQKEHAKNGDAELGDLLVDLLVDRSKQNQRDILQIVLNESLKVAPKLTKEQLAALAIIFLIRYTQQSRLNSDETLGGYFDKFVQPFAGDLVKNDACYQHLQFSSCGSVGAGFKTLTSILGSTYKGLFFKGFDQEELEKRQISVEMDSTVFIQCLNDPKNLQVNAVNSTALMEHMDNLEISEEEKVKINKLFDLNRMSDDEIKEKCIKLRPYMENVFGVWSDSSMKSFNLTSVGIAIGHANIKRLAGEFADLSIWIN